MGRGWGSAILACLVASCGDHTAPPRVPVVEVDAIASMPVAAVSVPFALTFTATGGNGSFTWTLQEGLLPSGLALAATGVVTGTPTVVETRTFTVRVTSGGASASRVFTLVVDHPPVVVTTATLPVAVLGRSYFQLLDAAGGAPGTTTTWSLVDGTLPAGVVLLAAGTLSGTPSALGAHDVRLRATRGAQFAERQFRLDVHAPPLAITTTDLPDARVGQPYVAGLQASGGVGGFQWRVVSGRVPLGMTLAADGTLAGTPVAEDSAAMVVEVVSGAQQESRAFGLLVEPATYPASALVTMPGDVFAPFLVRVRPGGTVTWRFGTSPHNVIFAPAIGAPANIEIVSSVDVTRTFAVPGGYRYDCTIHPGMAGRVEVR